MPSGVAVTGCGAITALGNSVGETWREIQSGMVGIEEISRFETGDLKLRSRIAAEVDFEPEDWNQVDPSQMGRHAQLAVATVGQALEDAGLGDLSANDARRVGTSFASGMGGMPEVDEIDGRPPTKTMIRIPPSLAAGHISMTFNAKGPNRAPSTACAAGAHAIMAGVEDIKAGRAEVVIAGGTETPVTPLGVQSFDAMRALSTRNEEPAGASRPFDADRDGFVIGEGTGALILEEQTHAEDRGVEPQAFVTGYGRSADAEHPTRPSENADGLKRCIRRALQDASISIEDVDLVNAHGTSTPRGDAHEAKAINDISDTAPLVTSNKGHLGHTLGATGAIEAVISVRSLQEQQVPPTANYTSEDPACDIPVVREMRHESIETIMSNSAGFGGTNGTLILEST